MSLYAGKKPVVRKADDMVDRYVPLSVGALQNQKRVFVGMTGNGTKDDEAAETIGSGKIVPLPMGFRPGGVRGITTPEG